MNDVRYYDEFVKACNIPGKDCKKYFKVYDKELPRIVKVIGLLKSIYPNSILDVGPGRGRALWPIAHSFPEVTITCVEKSEWRHTVIDAVHRGGVKRISSLNIDISQGTSFGNDSFDVVTALEVIEHIPNYHKAMAEIFRVARNFIVVSVPSKPDNNPDHINFFSQEDFEEVLDRAEQTANKQIKRIVFDFIPKHMIVIVKF